MDSVDWKELPVEILGYCAHISLCDVHSDEHKYEVLWKMRLICNQWHKALPIGQFVPLKVWKPSCATACNLTIEGPVTSTDSFFLPSLHHCTQLHLENIDAHVLPCLSVLTQLRHLGLDISFPDWDEKQGMEWMLPFADLKHLTTLRCSAEPLRLQPAASLFSITGLTALAALELEDCVMLNSEAAGILGMISSLKQVTVKPGLMSQVGIQTVLQGCSKLTSMKSTVQDVESAELVLHQTNLKHVHLDLKMMGSSVAAVLQCIEGRPAMSNLHSLTIVNGNCRILLPGPIILPKSLHKLDLHGVSLSAAAIRQIAALTSLQDLSVEAQYTVRSDSLSTWTSLTHLTRLVFTGNWFLPASCVATVLTAMPAMRDLKLTRLQADCVTLLQQPLQTMKRLQHLKLTMCRLEQLARLGPTLAVRGGTLHSLGVKWCGNASVLVSTLADAVREMPHLRKFHVSVESDVAAESLNALTTALKECTKMRELNVDVSAGLYTLRTPRTQDSVDWAQLACLTQLRSLIIAASLGWTCDAVHAVALGAKNLRRVSIQDGVCGTGDEWLKALTPLRQLKRLSLQGCSKMSEHALSAVHGLTALTEIRAVRSGGLGGGGALGAARAALPCLVQLNVYE